jgi:hypothetical protein
VSFTVGDIDLGPTFDVLEELEELEEAGSRGRSPSLSPDIRPIRVHELRRLIQKGSDNQPTTE